MRVYASTACVPGAFWPKLAAFRGAGLLDVELGAGEGPGPGGLAARLQAEGLRYLVHNYFPPPAEPFVLNLASPDPDVLERSERLVEAALRLAAAVGAPLYSVHAGFVTDPLGFAGGSFAFGRGGDAAAARERFAGALGRAQALADGLGVELLVENNVCTEALRGALLLQTADEFEELPGVAILLDTGHLNVSAHTLGFDRLDFARRLGPRIRAVHLHDNDGAADRHEAVAAGSWALEAVRLTGAATVVVEARFATVAELRTHVEWLGATL